MKIAIGSDHRGFEAKERIKALLQSIGLDVEDYGAHASQPCDYPDTGLAVAEAVSTGLADRGGVVLRQRDRDVDHGEQGSWRAGGAVP